MNIKICRRSISKYISFEVEFDHATYELGVLNHQEAKELAEYLRETADDILQWANVTAQLEDGR